MVLEKKVLFQVAKRTDAVPLLFCMFVVFNHTTGANSLFIFGACTFTYIYIYYIYIYIYIYNMDSYA